MAAEIPDHMIQLRRRVPAASTLIGAALPIILTVAIVVLRLEYLPTLVVAFLASFGSALYVGQRFGAHLASTVAALVIPATVLFSIFALNAASWPLLGVPTAMLGGSIPGVALGRRRWSNALLGLPPGRSHWQR